MAARDFKLDDQLSSFRQAATRLGSSVDPIAYSIGAREFGFECNLNVPWLAGDFVEIVPEDGRLLVGQIFSRKVFEREGPEVGIDMSVDSGVLLAKMASTGSLRHRPMSRTAVGTGIIYAEVKKGKLEAFTGPMFSQAEIRSAKQELIADFTKPPEDIATLEVGTTSYGISAMLRADGFTRHTFLCGQSGSGKTFALGVLVEQVLTRTKLPVIVLDPNSDFIRLGSSKKLSDVNRSRLSALDTAEYERRTEFLSALECEIYSNKDISIGKDRGRSTRPVKVRLEDFRDIRDQATVLGLDPVQDPEEFYAYLRIADRYGPQREGTSYVEALVRGIGSELSPEYRMLALRLKNLGIADWKIWANPENSAASVCDNIHKSRAIEVDLGSTDQREALVVSLAALNRLWFERELKKPVLVVIDEAHSLCPREPTSSLQAAVCESVIRLAGEGRKYGIYLLITTQRPEKIHPNILTQCENLFLMKMNSRDDAEGLAQVFSSTPQGLFWRAADFQQGQSLVVGRFTKSPLLVKFGGRQTPESGGDIPTDWAVPF
jgi:hypothetical protein